MALSTRVTKTVSLDPAVLKQVQRTRGTHSTSERVNQLLKAGLEMEKRRKLHKEISEFFADEPNDDDGSRGSFQRAAMEAWARGEE